MHEKSAFLSTASKIKTHNLRSGLHEASHRRTDESSEFAVYNLTTNVFGFSFRGSAYELFGINP